MLAPSLNVPNVGVNVAGSRGGAGRILSSAGFILPLSDLGAGAVNTTLLRGTGSATFTRATVAWTKLSTGLWAQVASGTARSCYLGADTAVGAYGGYLAEAAGIQLVTPTASIRDMTDASWAKVTMTTAKTSTGIDGVANSCTRLTAAGANSTILQTLVAAASSRTYACWIKRITGTGAIGICQDGATFTDITSQINSTTFTRVSLTASQLNAVMGIRITTSGDAIDVDFNQFEAGGFATSPMASAGAARNVDVLTYPFAGNVDAAQGTFYAVLSTLWSASPQAAAISSGFNGAASSFLYATNSLAATSIRSNDGTNATNKTGLTSMATGVRKRAMSYGALGQLITGDGATVASAAFDGAFPADGLAIGCDVSGTNPWGGTIGPVYIWTTQLAASQLQAITA